ncbi:hypothetical protein KUTeg_022593 [Tegillarca granosa]|uniref:Uncharacterized protein n=1 Tax=Tegillarca granosa TaxID=220873 RepID=A0ABQ9E7U1_TEGGR|nr:hypothetical protein KUTeg_022593 [Tegillarca granosa]
MSILQFYLIIPLFHFSKAINEEGETDSFGSGQDLGPSNITESESLESLDEVDSSVVSVGRHCDDELLMLGHEEAERWSVTVDKKTLKKMTAKDIKRQDTIWELIQTERHHCRTLKILQKIYGQGLYEDFHMPKEVVDRLFPKLEDLIEIHMAFLKNLQDLQNRREDHSIDEVGTLLVDQFNGDSVEKMSIAYGAFCSSHKDSVLLYKDLLARDRNFQSFIKRCNNHTLCKKREIPDFMLLVTQRLSKYPTLIEAILKSTKDKKDRENLSTALQLSKDLLHNVDEQVDEYERQQRLVDIYNRMDARATTSYMGKKFKKSDLLAGRRLIYEGIVGYKNARGKVTEVMAVILTDVILFLMETNQKYTFFSQDNKSSVIPLFQLLVRGKDDTRDSKGIYLISQNKQNPEMYELVCRTGENRHQWIEMARQAVEKCPEPESSADDIVPDESEEDRKMEARSAKVRDIIDQLQKKDLEIKACCDEKNSLMIELLEIYSWKDEPQRQRPNSLGEEEGTEHMDALQAAIQEVSVTASRLTTMLQGNGSQLSRHVSSVGEHYSNSYSCPPVPKRAETFAGFDTSFDISKGYMPKKKYLSEVYDEGRSTSLQNLDTSRTDSDSDICHGAGCYRQTEADDSLESRVYERLSDNGSIGDISGSSTHSFMVSGDYMTSISQLARSLHSIVHLTAQQGTAVETLRAQLAEANERINKLSAEVHERKGGYRHNQLEELRNLQSELQSQKEELRRQKEVLQKQIDMWEQGKSSSHKDKDSSHHGQSLPKHASSPGMATTHHHSLDQDKGTDSVEKRQKSCDDASQNNTHRRSASADFCQAIEDDLERLRQGSQPRSMRREMPTRSDSRASVSSVSSAKQNLPMHLLSAKNEQRHAKQLPTRHVPSQSSGTPPPPGVQQVLPHKLAASTSSGALTGQSSNNNSAIQSPSGASASLSGSSSTSSLSHKLSNRPKNSGAPPASNLSLLMKLAEPNSKGRTASASSIGEKSLSNQKTDPPQSTASPGSQGQKSGGNHKSQKSDSGVIYF